MMEENAKISVNKLMNTYHKTLTSLTPLANRYIIDMNVADLGIGKTWSEVCKALFKGIVSTPLSNGIKNCQNSEYGIDYRNYNGLCYIGVTSIDYEGVMFAFVSFCTEDKFLDSIKVAILNKEYTTVGYLILENKNIDYFHVSGKSQTSSKMNREAIKKLSTSLFATLHSILF